jgi:hypothetical protein
MWNPARQVNQEIPCPGFKIKSCEILHVWLGWFGEILTLYDKPNQYLAWLEKTQDSVWFFYLNIEAMTF